MDLIITVGKLGAGGARYYTDVLGAVDEYYSEAGTRPGVWMGDGAVLLGLAGEVSPDVLSVVLAGGDPRSGDPSGGEPTSGGRLDGGRLAGSRSSVPGFDLCFRAPKSVSLMQALGDPEAGEAVLAAHRSAVCEALGWLEREAAMVRRGHAGVTLMRAAGLVGAGFEHFTSRAGDPHLHTHVVVANVARGDDGRWTALDGRAIYHQARTAGFLYEAALRANLTKTLGVDWGPVVNGIADLAGVSKELIGEFSQRRAQIVAELAAQGATSAKAAQVAALSTRPSKATLPSLETLRGQWRERSVRLGMDPAGWDALADPGERAAGKEFEAGGLDADVLVERLLGPDGLTHSQSCFERSEVLRAVAEMARHGARVADIEAAADRVLADGRVVAVAGGGWGGRRWSTGELVGLERWLVDYSLAVRQMDRAVVGPELLARTMQYRGLSGEQRKMVESLCRSGDGVQVVIGVAGAGKTYALGAAYDAWRDANIPVCGTALSARAAKELQDGSHITSFTVAKLCSMLDDPGHGGLAKGSVVVVDEAAMVSTRQLAVLASHAYRAGAKLVLVGDERQLPSIQAGGIFAELAEQVGAVTLSENRRQALAWERDALAFLRDGRVDVALSAYHARGRRHDLSGHRELCDKLVGDWSIARDAGHAVMMLATRRADVDTLNRLARDRLQQAGRVGPDLVEAAGRGYGVGDEIICGRNNPVVGVINGTRGTVVGISADGQGLIVDADGRRVGLPARYLADGHVSHGYATTIHKAQGATTERTFILADELLYQEAGYVALSRGRAGNDIYTTIVEDRRDDDRHGRRDTRREGREGPDRLRVGLGRSRAQRAAIAAETPALPGRTLAEFEADRRRLQHDMTDGQVERDAGEQEHRRLEWKIDQRTKALGDWAVVHPQPEHLGLLGEAPREPERRREWTRAAAELSAYHERYGHPYQAGLAPEHDRALELYRHGQVERTLREVEPYLDRSHSLENLRHIGRGIEL